ncbi:MAG: SEL1-like repeat protein [Rhodospirillales bacterium]|nr:SEL1-like repeat protein [Rhodospirillales bacterium]
MHGYIKLSAFFSPSDKYQQWFHKTAELQVAPGNQRTGSTVQAAPSGEATSLRYPYPDKKFVMTEALWNKSSQAIIDDKSDWFDSEVIRHRAEVDEHPPAMDFLAWMYQEGRGVDKNNRKAYMWYERAKLAGFKDTTGSTAKIFNRLKESDKFFAELQLAEDIKEFKSGQKKSKLSKEAIKDFEEVDLRVMRNQRDPEYLKRLRGQDR